MVKVIFQVYPVIHAADEAERTALRPIGRNADRYQQALNGLPDIVQAADALGLWGIASIEHHFHSEGYEVGPDPGVLNAYWAAITKNIRVGQLGYVMSAQHPIRVAEQTAILDHLSRGRCFVGFARGYQDRWTNIIGQHLGTRATHSLEGADDALNREIFEEQVELVIRAWTEDSIELKSPRWQIPYPYDDGIDWWMRETTARLGAPGELGPDGRVRRVSVVPAPYTKPHPPIFVGSSASAATVEYCGRNGFIPTYFGGVERTVSFGPRYVEAAAQAGHTYALGQNQAAVRWLQIADDRDALRRALSAYDTEIYKNFYNQLHSQARHAPDALPLDAGEEQILDRLEQSPQHATGTVDEVRELLVSQRRDFPAEYIVLILHYAQQPADSVIRNLETFMREVKPALDELTMYPEPATAEVAPR